MLVFDLVAIVFKQIFHFGALDLSKRFRLQEGVQGPLAAIPINQFPAYSIKLVVIFEKTTLDQLLKNTEMQMTTQKNNNQLNLFN